MPKLMPTLDPQSRLALSPRQRTILEAALDRRAALKASLDQLQAEYEDLNARLLHDADDAGGSIDLPNWTITATDGQSAGRINRELLLKAGVSLKIIRTATVPGKTYRYPRVTAKRGDRHDVR